MLPLTISPFPYESALGFVRRSARTNALLSRDLIKLAGADSRQAMCMEHIPLLAHLTDVDVAWLARRTPSRIVVDGDSIVQLFGHQWRSSWLLRGLREQVCPVCLGRAAVERLEWALVPYCCCHVHGVYLVDTCCSCGKALMFDRLDTNLCRCGDYCAPYPEDAEAAPRLLVDWCAWLSEQVNEPVEPDRQVVHGSIGGLCLGHTPDGAYRMAYSLAGGRRSFRGAQIGESLPWLTTRKVAELLQSGLERWMAVRNDRLTSDLDRWCIDALADQAAHGMSAWDRAAAMRLLTPARRPARRRRSTTGQLREQLPLFGGDDA